MIKIKMKRVIIFIALIIILVLGIYWFIPSFRSVQTAKSVSVIFYPSGVVDCEILIYDNDDKDYSAHIVYEIMRSKTALFYTPRKCQLAEGFYKIIVEEENNKSEYEVSTKGIVYDVENDKYLKYDFTEDIYLFLAMQKLDEVVALEENSEEYVRFLYERPFRYLRQ